jgi:hypothetical protein
MGSIGFNNNVLLNKYQAYQYGAGPITLNSGTPLEGMIRLGASDMMEDIRFMGGFRLSTNLKDNEWYFGFQHLKRRLDWSLAYYRNVQGAGGIILKDGVVVDDGLAKVYTNLYQGGISYPLNENSRLMLNTGIRSDNTAVSTLDPISASINSQRTLFSLTHFEYVYDNSMNPTMNIWNGLRYKFYFDWNRQVGKINKPEGPYTFTLGQPGENTSAAGRTAFNFGFDARYYYPIYRHFIWAGRAAGDFSWGNQKICYYLGGVDGWLMFGQNQKQLSNGSIKERFYNTSNQPDPDQFYAFQSLAVNMRGYIQNIANGNNAVVLNSEFRLPVMSTFFDKIVSNSFLQNLMVVQFIDLGTAWNGAYRSIQRPSFLYNTPDIQGNPGPVTVKIKTGGIGPFAGGYGFGLRSTVLGYYLKFDCSWPMGAFFRGPAITYFALGLDF